MLGRRFTGSGGRVEPAINPRLWVDHSVVMTSRLPAVHASLYSQEITTIEQEHHDAASGALFPRPPQAPYLAARATRTTESPGGPWWKYLTWSWLTPPPLSPKPPHTQRGWLSAAPSLPAPSEPVCPIQCIRLRCNVASQYRSKLALAGLQHSLCGVWQHNRHNNSDIVHLSPIKPRGRPKTPAQI